jgi:hypothetical protein
MISRTWLNVTLILVLLCLFVFNFRVNNNLPASLCYCKQPISKTFESEAEAAFSVSPCEDKYSVKRWHSTASVVNKNSVSFSIQFNTRIWVKKYRFCQLQNTDFIKFHWMVEVASHRSAANKEGDLSHPSLIEICCWWSGLRQTFLRQIQLCSASTIPTVFCFHISFTYLSSSKNSANEIVAK